MEGRKRKRAPHHTACWECHRLHRSCDGERPCRRCVANGKAGACQSIPRKPYARKRKPGEEWLNEQTLSLSIFHQSSANSPPTPPVTFPTTTTKNTEEEKQRLLTELLQQVQQVQQMTQSLQMRQDMMSQQLVQLKTVSQPTEFEFDSYGSESSSPSSPSDISPNCSPSTGVLDSPIQFYDFGQMLSSPELPASHTQTELLDLLDISHDPKQSLALTVSNDLETFKESLFIPFAIKDATKPFYIFRPEIFNWELFLHYPHKPRFCDCKPDPRVATVTILSANLSFCDMAKYQEDELVGESIFKFLPPTHNIHDEDHQRFKKYLMPQPPHVHVSDVIHRRGEFQAKDGTLLSGFANVQLFYNEGTVSFGVASILSFKEEEQQPASLRALPPPPSSASPFSPMQTPPDTPSIYFSPFDDSDDCCSGEGHSHHHGQEKADASSRVNVWAVGSPSS